MELRNLTELPENVTSRGTMSGMNNETEFYTGQQAYGLLLSACNLHLTNDAVQQVHSIINFYIHVICFLHKVFIHEVPFTDQQ